MNVIAKVGTQNVLNGDAAPPPTFRANIGKVGVPASGMREAVTLESWNQSGARLPPIAKMGPHSRHFTVRNHVTNLLISVFSLSHVLTLQ